jgi:uncharacterized protein
LLQLIHPLPGRREQRRADQHHARKPRRPPIPTSSLDRQVPLQLGRHHGQVIATSEAYESNASAVNGIESIKRNAPNAEIDDQTDK